MRHIKKIPPADKLLCEQLLSSGWRKLKEPENIWTVEWVCLLVMH